MSDVDTRRGDCGRVGSDEVWRRRSDTKFEAKQSGSGSGSGSGRFDEGIRHGWRAFLDGLLLHCPTASEVA
jgi:hypothetical protein